MNVYKKIRQESGLSREEVCAMTDDNGVRKIDTSRLERIENDKLRIYPNEVVILSEVYDKPMLCNKYCTEECEIGKRYVFPIADKELELEKIVLPLIASLNSIKRQQERLIEISSDGKIDESELSDFVKIETELQNISKSIETLKIWAEKELKHTQN